MLRALRYFSKFELLLWSTSVLLSVLAFWIFDRESVLNLVASLVGVTSLILCAKGNPFGQVLMIVFSLLYGVISFSCAYYGEMITYVFLTMPMAIVALVSWLRHPYAGRHSEVAVGRLSRREIPWLVLLSASVTVAFYFILRYFGTANLLPSTLSVTTSFVAVYLTARRSPYFALAYAANDVVLILLWGIASISEVRYLSVTFCFLAFFFNDLYGFVSWQRMKRRQGL